MIKHTFILALGVLALASTSKAACGNCTDTNFAACINTTSYKICFDGETPSDVIAHCAPGEVCTVEVGVCMPSDDSTTVVDCVEQCGHCATRFACISKTEYAMCTADDKPGTFSMKCPPNEYCNIKSYDKGRGPICVKSCIGEPSCANDVAEKPDPQKEYIQSCTAADPTGPYPNKSDPSCKTYVYCEVVATDVVAILFTCPINRMYFDKVKKECVEKRPSYCSL